MPMPEETTLQQDLNHLKIVVACLHDGFMKGEFSQHVCWLPEGRGCLLGKVERTQAHKRTVERISQAGADVAPAESGPAPERRCVMATKLVCDHCGKPITDTYQDNYHVRMTDEEEWTVHVDCYPEWQVQMLEFETNISIENGDLEDETVGVLMGEAWRLERAVKAHQKLLGIIAKCQALLAG